jgi:hypothetical protein
MEHVLEATSGERGGSLCANGQYVARLYVILSDVWRHLRWDRATICTDWINLPPRNHEIFLVFGFLSDFDDDIPALGTASRPIYPNTPGRKKTTAVPEKRGTVPGVGKMDATMRALHKRLPGFQKIYRCLTEGDGKSAFTKTLTMSRLALRILIAPSYFFSSIKPAKHDM